MRLQPSARPFSHQHPPNNMKTPTPHRDTMTPPGDALYRRLPSSNMNRSFRFLGSLLGAFFAWLCVLIGSATAQTPLQDLPSTVISAGGTFNFSGSASFIDLNTGYDGDLGTAGNQPFDTGYLVKSVSGLGTLTTLNLGQAAGAPASSAWLRIPIT